MTQEQYIAYTKVYAKFAEIIDNEYCPSHVIDILNECIKLLKPIAAKQEEVTHA